MFPIRGRNRPQPFAEDQNRPINILFVHMNYKQLMVRNNIKNKGQRKTFHKNCNYEQIFFVLLLFTSLKCVKNEKLLNGQKVHTQNFGKKVESKNMR